MATEYDNYDSRILAAIEALATGGSDMTAANASLSVMDDWDESDRAKINPIVGQAGVAAGAGAVAATVQRMTLASDDPAVASLSVLDDWDETDRAKVNLIVGQAGVAAGAGSVAATVQRMTLASDDPAVASLSVMDDWDETDRAKVNLIVGQAGVAAGAGAVSATVIRTTSASDDPAVTALTAIRAVGLNASATFTPAAASHTANDCNGAAQQFSFGAVSGSNIIITAVSLLINSGTAEATSWRLYLYNVTPPSATADDGAWDLPGGDQASFLGYVDLFTAIDMGAATQYVEATGLSKQIKLAGTSVFGYLINNTTLTPAAVAHIVTLNAQQL